MENKWNDFRSQYMGIIQNLINNIDICNRRYVEEGDEGYLSARKKYIEEVEELKTFIVKKELELGFYKKESINEEEK
tara:strand:+ start:3463 stop:3693 length:231 start_codon:yes stop_codon:yes gene_type:complete